MKSYEAARSWRERRKLTREQLSEITGYSVDAIRQIEAGKRFGGATHSEWTLLRYRMACSGAERQLKSGRAFEW